MITSWFWLLTNFALIIAFFACGQSYGRRSVGSVYTRNGLVPFISAINFATQVMILHVYYYYGMSCYGSTCCKLRKASFGLAIVSLILSFVAIVDLLFDNCREEEQITGRALVI